MVAGTQNCVIYRSTELLYETSTLELKLEILFGYKSSVVRWWDEHQIYNASKRIHHGACVRSRFSPCEQNGGVRAFRGN